MVSALRYVIAATCAAVASGAFTTLVQEVCTSLDCTSCQTTTVPLDKCLYGGYERVTCSLTSQRCLSLQEFGKSATCDGAPLGMVRTICGQCFGFPGANGTMSYGVVRGCEGDSAIFAYECDAGCSGCKKTEGLTVGKCAFSPVTQQYYKPIGSGSCPPIADFQTWGQPNNCASPPTSNASAVTMTCFNDYTRKTSSRMTCK